MIHIVMYRTPAEKAKGLQHMAPIPPETLFVFPNTPGGQQFHSRNVMETFDICFVDARGEVLECATIVPPRETILTHPETFVVLEAKGGELRRMGIQPGKVVNLVALMEGDTLEDDDDEQST
jgi:uncharacterized membrane protein (UPF0127 family)